MIDSTLLFSGMTTYSPWFPRQADMLRVTAECLAVNATSLVVQLYTKNSTDPGDGLPVDEGVDITLDAPGRSSVEWKTVANEKGVEQLLRFRFMVGEDPTNEWILFRLLPAVWFDAVNV